MPPTESELHPDDTINIASLEIQALEVQGADGSRLVRGQWREGSNRQGPTTLYPFGPTLEGKAQVVVEVPRSEDPWDPTLSDDSGHQEAVTEVNLSLIHVQTGDDGRYLVPVDAPKDGSTSPEGRILIYYGKPGSGTAELIFNIPDTRASR